jgi:PAS domain S-box-containing protein
MTVFDNILHDPKRLAALQSLALLDTPPEEAFDRLTRLAARTLDVPIVLVSLVDKNRQFFKSCLGLPEPWASMRETPLSHSICQHVVESSEPLILSDVRKDPVIRHSLAISELGVVAYAGMPLITPDGYVLGTLCAIDRQPRTWTEKQVEILKDLAASVMTEIELRVTAEAARLQAEAAEQERKSKMALLESTGEGLFGIDLNGNCTFINRAGAEMLGYQAHELLGKNMHKQIHHTRSDGSPYPEDECPIFRAFHVGQGCRVENEFVWRRDGTCFPVEYTSYPLLEDGLSKGAVVTFVDITERKRAELEQERLLKQLENERGRLEAVLQQMPAGVLIAEAPSGRLLLGNQQVEDIWRHPFVASEDIEHYKDYRGFHEDGRPYQPDEWPLARSISTGETIAGEEIIFHRGDNTYGVMRVSAAPILDRDDNIVAGVATFYDITDRRRAEVAQQFLAEASALLGSSLDYETTLSSVAQLAVPHLTDWCIVDVLDDSGSARRIEIAHVDPSKVALAHDVQRRYPSDRNAPRGVADVLRTGQPELVPAITDELLQAAAKNEEHLQLLRELGLKSYMIVPMVARGRTLGAITFICAESGYQYGSEDLALATDLARRAAQAVDNAQLFEQAQEAISARDEFLSIASHELKTPLTSLKLQIQSMLRSTRRGIFTNKEPERLLHKLQLADQQAGRIAKLIDSLLDVARIRSGQLDLRLEEVELAAVVRDVATRFQEQVAQAGCTVELQIDQPIVGRWDRSRIEQIVTNLLSNAVKYGEGKPIEIGIQADATTASLIVSDQGIGIAPDQLERIFVRFERVVSANEYGGLGLGLYIVYQIVEALQGSIHVTSEPGAGSTFIVKLPLNGPNSATKQRDTR